jgi:hypothetical protein
LGWLFEKIHLRKSRAAMARDVVSGGYVKDELHTESEQRGLAGKFPGGVVAERTPRSFADQWSVEDGSFWKIHAAWFESPCGNRMTDFPRS